MSIRRIWITGRHVKNLLLFRNITPSFYFIEERKKIAYLNNSKVACSSIKASLYSITIDNKIDDDGFNKAKLSLGKRVPASTRFDNYFKFTFVRNPFERIFSCYFDKVLNPKKKLYFYRDYLFGYIKEGESFDSFVRKISNLPDKYSDGHFKSQYSLIHRNGKTLVDFIGKMENISEDFSHLVNTYDLDQLPHYNKTESAQKPRSIDYFSRELVDLVYQRYRNDFDLWYPDAYQVMLTKLEKIESENKKGN